MPGTVLKSVNANAISDGVTNFLPVGEVQVNLTV